VRLATNPNCVEKLKRRVDEFLHGLGITGSDYKLRVYDWKEGHVRFEVVLSDYGKEKLSRMGMDVFQLLDRLGSIVDEVLTTRAKKEVVVDVDVEEDKFDRYLDLVGL
jgi:hypothetical protein